MATTFLTFFILLSTALFILSLYHMHAHRGHRVNFIYKWGILFGTFVWEDLLVFSLLHLSTALISLYNHDLRLWLLFFLIFWIIRSHGETQYWFLQIYPAN